MNEIFNPSHPARAGVRYYTVAGDAGKDCKFGPIEWRCAENWQQLAWPTKSGPLGFISFVQAHSAAGLGILFQALNNGGSYEGTNDFAVTVRSTRLMDIPGHNSGNTVEYVYSRNHHTIRSAMKRLGEKDTTITDLIISLLDIGAYETINNSSDLALFEGQAYSGNPKSGPDNVSINTAEDSSLYLEDGVIGEGEVIHQAVGVDTDSMASFLLLWEEGDLYINLIDPSGKMITPTSTEEYITYFESRDVDANADPFIVGKTAGYGVVGPVVGGWQVQIIAADSLPATETTWALIVTQESDITVSIAPDQPWKRLNETVQLISEVKNGKVPLTDATVEGHIIEPDGVLRTIPLYDDGTHGDGAASDGVYGNHFVGSQFGVYSLSAKATGIWNGIPYSRTAIGAVQVASGTAAITGAFGDKGVDQDGDGLFDVIRITVPISVTSRGQFMVSGQLRSGTDVLLSTANTSGEFDPGQHTLALDFDAEQILGNGGSGRFRLSNVMLLDMSTVSLPVQIDFSAMPYLTGNYGTIDLQHPALYLTGAINDYGVDADSDGEFDELVVEFGVWLQSGGDLGWNGRLVDGEGHEIAVYTGGSDLGAGPQTIAFRFNGKAIGEKHLDGPYFLVDLELWGNDGYLNAANIGVTAAYKYCQFASAGPCSGSECNVPVTGDWEVTSSCTLHTDRRVAGQVVVREGVILTIPEGLLLDVDFQNHNLRIKPGGKVLIKPGGKIE